jgi:hypothetical protein
VSKPNLDKVSNIHLRKLLAQDYRAWARIWNWSTADAIRYELVTWWLVWWKSHIQKWNDILLWIQKRFNSKDIKGYDLDIAKAIFNDITNALNGK